MPFVINILGHLIEVADEDELTFDKPVQAEVLPGESFEIRAPASSDNATLVTLIMGGGGLSTEKYLVLQPSLKNRSSRQIGIAELRPIRTPSGYNMKDYAHQFNLFNAVGRVTVASGHIEMAMKKVLVTLRGGDLMSRSIPTVWGDLVKELRKYCDGSTDLVTELAGLLDGAEDRRLLEQRNDVIHGYWWMVAAHDHLINARHYRPRDEKEPEFILNSHVELQKFAQELFDFANGIEKLVVPYWPIAMLSSDEQNDPLSAMKVEVVTDVPPGTPLRIGERLDGESSS